MSATTLARYDKGGPNTASEAQLAQIDMPAAPDAILDYDGDEGNMTTLNHTLYVQLIANTTVGHVMDMRTQTLCSEYEFGAW